MSTELIIENLNQHISKQISRLFVIDVLPKDARPEYDLDGKGTFCYLENNSVKHMHHMRSFLLPTVNNLNEATILSLVKETIYLATDDANPTDVSHWIMVHDPESDLEKLEKAYYAHCQSTLPINKENWLPMPSLGTNVVYFLSEPEWFGCISIDATRFGAFCVPNSIKKVYLNKISGLP